MVIFFSKMKETIEKIQEEKSVLEQACVLKDVKLFNVQCESNKKLQNLHKYSTKLESEMKSWK